jgi:hypothetical protein
MVVSVLGVDIVPLVTFWVSFGLLVRVSFDLCLHWTLFLLDFLRWLRGCVLLRRAGRPCLCPFCNQAHFPRGLYLIRLCVLLLALIAILERLAGDYVDIP